MRRLNTAVKIREKRRKDRRSAGKAAKAGRVWRNREERPRPNATIGGAAAETGPGVGTHATPPVDYENSPPVVDSLPLASPAVPEKTPEFVRPSFKPTTKPVIKSVTKPTKPPPVVPKEERPHTMCRSKECPHPDEPGCGKLGRGKASNPLIDCGYTRYKYKNFCRNCKEGRDPSGNIVKDRIGKGVRIVDGDTKAELAWYCSRQCSRFGSNEEDYDGAGPPVNCRSRDSDEPDEPGCGRKTSIVEKTEGKDKVLTVQ